MPSPRITWTFVSTRFTDDLGSVDVRQTTIAGIVVARTRRYNDRTFVYSVNGASYRVCTEAEAFASARGLADARDIAALNFSVPSLGSQRCATDGRGGGVVARRMRSRFEICVMSDLARRGVDSIEEADSETIDFWCSQTADAEPGYEAQDGALLDALKSERARRTDCSAVAS